MDRLDQLIDRSVAAASRRTPPVSTVVARARARTLRRRAGLAALTGVAVAGTAAGVAFAPSWGSGGDGSVSFASGVSTPSSSGWWVPRTASERKAAAAGLGFDLVERVRCPAAVGATWSVRLAGDASLADGDIVAVTTARAGSPLAEMYRITGGAPGWLGSSSSVRVSSGPAGSLVVTEWSGRGIPPTGDIAAKDTGHPGCGADRWERAETGSDANLSVLTGDTALVAVMGARARGGVVARLGEVGPGVQVTRIRTGQQDIVAFDLRPAGVVAVVSAAGTVPPPADLFGWLARQGGPGPSGSA